MRACSGFTTSMITPPYKLMNIAKGNNQIDSANLEHLGKARLDLHRQDQI